MNTVSVSTIVNSDIKAIKAFVKVVKPKKHKCQVQPRDNIVDNLNIRVVKSTSTKLENQ